MRVCLELIISNITIGGVLIKKMPIWKQYKYALLWINYSDLLYNPNISGQLCVYTSGADIWKR